MDTNVLVYLFDRDAPAKRARAKRILEDEGLAGNLVLSTQVLQEFYVTVTRKLAKPLPDKEALLATRRWSALQVVQVDPQMIFAAIALSQERHVSLWDALIIQAALDADCRRLFSEDLQDGWELGGLRVENPFRPARSGSPDAEQPGS